MRCLTKFFYDLNSVAYSIPESEINKGKQKFIIMNVCLEEARIECANYYYA